MNGKNDLEQNTTLCNAKKETSKQLSQLNFIQLTSLGTANML